MEKHKRSCRQGRKEVQLSMRNNAGGSGIEGVVVLGGALAIASLVAAFTIKKGSRKDGNLDATNLAATDSCRKKGDGTEGLGFILQEDNSSSILHQSSCCTNHGTSKIGITEIESCESVPTQSLITSEENRMQGERKDSVGHQEIPIHDTEQESISFTGGYGDIEEISRPVTDHHKPMNVVENESDDSLVIETIEIEIEDEAVDADAEQSTAEEKSTLQSSLSSVSSTEEEKASLSTGGEDEEENSLMQSSFLKEEEDEEKYSPMRSSFSTEEEEEDEEKYSPMRSSFSTEEEEEEEECSPMESSFSKEEEEDSPLQSSFSTGEEDEEEYPLMQSSFSTEDEDEEEYSPMRSSFSTEEEEEEEYSPMESSFSKEEDEEEEVSTLSSLSTGEEEDSLMEEYLPIRSTFSTEEEEYSPMKPSSSTDEEEDSLLQSSSSTEEEEDEKDANVTETEEESSEGTWSSSTDSNMKPIWPAEMIGVLSPESKEMNVSHLVSVKKFEEKDTTANKEAYRHHLANTFDERGCNNGKNKKDTQELVLMNG